MMQNQKIEYDYLIVGAGFYGCVIAERLANVSDCSVLVIDKRPHIGGNCFSVTDKKTGIEIHQYGTHIFHTSSEKVWHYITQFTEFNSYYHQVLTTYKDKVYQMPINLETINSFYGKNFKPFEAEAFIKDEIKKENIDHPKNLEEKAISLIGRPLYEAFIKGYTIKQWDKDPKALPAEIITRLPMRFDYCETYFHDARWQGIPLDGYTKIFERMLDAPNISVRLNCNYFDCKDDIRIRNKVIYTGPLDSYFDNCYGELEWRTVHFRKEYKDVEDYQGTSVMNYADSDCGFTRIHEPRHLHPERQYNDAMTVIFYENSTLDSSDPYYPVNTQRNHELFDKYMMLAKKEEDVIFGGRLGDYAYYDMDKAILAALTCFENNINE